MREANKRAAAAAFQANNRAGVRDSDTVDLHDLYVEEALGCLRTRLGEARQEARLLAGLPALLLAGRCATVQQLCAHEAQASLLDLPCGKVDATLFRVKVALDCRTRSLALCVLRQVTARTTASRPAPKSLHGVRKAPSGHMERRCLPARSVESTSQLRSAAWTCWGCFRFVRARRRAWSTWSWCTARGTTVRAACSG